MVSASFCRKQPVGKLKMLLASDLRGGRLTSTVVPGMLINAAHSCVAMQ